MREEHRVRAVVGVAEGEGALGEGPRHDDVVGVLAPPNTQAVTGAVTVSGLTVDGRPVELGGSGTWRDTAADDVVVSGTFADTALTLRYANNGSDKAFLPHASVPDVVPALTTAAAAPSAAGATFGGRSSTAARCC